MPPDAGQIALRIQMKLFIGLRYRVEGILHEYLGPARLPGGSEIAHVFLRNEWRPDTPGQLPLTLVEESTVDELVTKTRIGGRGR
jgi:hypothetical protein